MLTHVVDAKGGKRRKPGQDAAHFKTDDETGKMVIDDEGADTEDGGVPDDAYKESLTSADGFTRGPNGRIKFNKDTKKRRRENADNDEDVEMGDADVATGKKNKRRTDVKLGHEFKAKVRTYGIYLPQNRLTRRAESRGRCQEGWCGAICLLAVVSSSQKAGTQGRRGEAMSSQLCLYRDGASLMHVVPLQSPRIPLP